MWQYIYTNIQHYMYCYMYQYVYISVHFEDGFCCDYTSSSPSHSITLIKFQVQVAIDYALLLFQYHWNAHYFTCTNTIILYMYIIVVQSCGLHVYLLHVYVMHISCCLKLYLVSIQPQRNMPSHLHTLHIDVRFWNKSFTIWVQEQPVYGGLKNPQYGASTLNPSWINLSTEEVFRTDKVPHFYI